MFVPKEGRLPRPVGMHFTLGERAPLSLLLTHDAVAVTRATSVESVVSFMLRMGLNTLPVVDGGGRLVGTVSTHDLLAEATAHRDALEQDTGLQPRERDALSDELDGGFHGSCLSTASIGAAMTPSTVALRDDASISHAVMTLMREGLSELPVRCERCEGYCIVSALELLTWLSRSRQEAR